MPNHRALAALDLNEGTSGRDAARDKLEMRESSLAARHEPIV